MANKTTLKGYFEIGDIPSQAQYADLIDSNLNLQETGTQILVGTLSASFLEVQNHITSSGNISASGYLVSSKHHSIFKHKRKWLSCSSKHHSIFKHKRKRLSL
jgi:hypothetical protein